MGFFDSGVGGLTVLSAFRKVLPDENCIFYGDTANMPYGEKTAEQLFEYSNKAFKFFEEKNVKAVIMACNTTSAVVYEELKDKYNFKLYPLIQSVCKIFGELPIKTIGVFATPATINSHAYLNHINKINPNIKVVEIPCPQWVKLVENNEINTEKAELSVADKMKEMLNHNPDKIILGCTHYPYLINLLSKHAPQNLFINPAEEYVKFIKNDLKSMDLINSSNIQGKDMFYVTAYPDKFITTGKRFYEVENCCLV